MTTRNNSARSASKKSQAPKTIKLDIEVNADEFTAGDYEALLNWSQGTSNLTITEVFDILDRCIIGGFRKRRFVDIKGVITTMLEQLEAIATGGSKN